MFTRRLSSAAALLTAVAALGCGPSLAGASTIRGVAVVGGTAIEDQAFVVTVTGEVEGSKLLVGRLNPLSQACAPDEAADEDRSVTSDSGYVEGAFTEAHTFTIDEPGDFRVCAYLGDELRADAPITVRSPAVGLTVSLPGDRFPPGSIAPLTLTHSSESRRGLRVDVNAAGSPCGPSPAANPGVTEVLDFSAGPLVLGQGNTTAVNVTIPETVGAYHVCGYVVESDYDAAPDLVVDGAPFLAGTPPPPAEVAPVAVAPVPGVGASAGCSVRTRAVRRGGRILVRCAGVRGRVVVRLSRRGHTRFRVRTRPAQGRVLVSTRRVRAGRYTVTVSTARGRLARRTVTVRPR